MKRFCVFLILVLVCWSLLSLDIHSAEATGTVQILADGSIVPSTAPIITSDNVTYTLTGNITSDADGIVILKNDILVDGAGYTVKGSDLGPYMAVNMDGRTNVTVRNMKITESWFGIHLSQWLVNSNRNTILENTITSTQYGIVCDGYSNQISENLITNNSNGIYVTGYANHIVENNITANSVGVWVAWQATGNVVSRNSIINNGIGVRVYIQSIANSICENQIRANDEGILLESYCSSNNLCSNNITENNDCGIFIDSSCSKNAILVNNITANNFDGIRLRDSEGNVIFGNNITENAAFGIRLSNSPNNRIYNNNYANYYQICPFVSINYWDDGYPSGGNYWSDYLGVDLNGDGIGDSPYIIDVNNIDSYPLINPWCPPDIATLHLSTLKTLIGQNYSATVTVTFENQGYKIEKVNVTISANLTPILHVETQLAANRSIDQSIRLVTRDIAYGNYTLAVSSEPLLGELDLSDNTCNCTVPIHVGVPGDISGPTPGVYDGTTNMRDVNYMILRFNSKPDSSNWNPNADVNNDATVNMRDIQIAILNFNQHE